MVEILRHHYEELWYFVPDYAMSAGTILVMSGDKIWMDYSSSLGPIDPQVPVQDGSEVRYVPALGILDKVDELIDKSAKGTLTDAEFAMLHKQNLGVIRAYEQARDLSIELLKKWLVQYKFRDWIKHRSDAKLKGKAVSDKQKLARAVEIAEMLSDNKIWHSHGRLIGMATLRNIVRLEIDDYTTDNDLRGLIREYHDTLTEYATRMGQGFCLHSAYRSTL